MMETRYRFIYFNFAIFITYFISQFGYPEDEQCQLPCTLTIIVCCKLRYIYTDFNIGSPDNMIF